LDTKYTKFIIIKVFFCLDWVQEFVGHIWIQRCCARLACYMPSSCYNLCIRKEPWEGLEELTVRQ